MAALLSKVVMLTFAWTASIATACVPVRAQAVSQMESAAGAPGKRATQQPIRILALGDSITQGGRRDRPEYTYRYPLFYLIREAGFSIDFIGSQRAGLDPDAVWPDKDGVPFDPDHEGHYGWNTVQLRDLLSKSISTYPAPPDIALVQVGSNDYDASSYRDAIIRPLQEIVATLRTANPHVVVLIGHVFEGGWKARWVRLQVELMAWRSSTQASPVATVPHHEGWRESSNADETDTFDGAHPNLRGQQKMAAKWFAAMLPHLRRMSMQGKK